MIYNSNFKYFINFLSNILKKISFWKHLGSGVKLIYICSTYSTKIVKSNILKTDSKCDKLFYFFTTMHKIL